MPTTQLDQKPSKFRDHTQRLACAAFMVSESCYRYEPKQDAENVLIADWLIRLTDNPSQLGFWPVLPVPA
jgi:putative transposase